MSFDFDVNFRNKRETTAQDITISMGLSEDNTKFPLRSTMATMTAPTTGSAGRKRFCPLQHGYPKRLLYRVLSY